MEIISKQRRSTIHQLLDKVKVTISKELDIENRLKVDLS